MTRKILLGSFFLIGLLSIGFAADPFYTNMLNEGKTLFLTGKYDEALEDFKIAEFGLLDEKEFLPELYYYYALTQYKKGALAESQALLEKLKTSSGEVNLNKLPKPKEIGLELSIMTRALDYMDRPGAKPGFIPFFNLFYETLEQLRAKKLDAAKANMERMDKMDGDDVRLAFLEGMLCFQQEDYKKCIKVIGKVIERIDPEFNEEASFYLAYSHLKRGNSSEGEKYARKIKDPGLIHRLMLLMDEIKAGNLKKGKKE
jgi:tetratricopeptide (TPR) repeat protein